MSTASERNSTDEGIPIYLKGYRSSRSISHADVLGAEVEYSGSDSSEVDTGYEIHLAVFCGGSAACAVLPRVSDPPGISTMYL